MESNSLKLTRIRCTNCGAEFENVSEGQRLFRCTRKGCGAVFLVEQGQRFSDVEQQRAEQIQRLRTALGGSLSPLVTEQAELYAREILALIPDDFRARAALCLCQAIKGKPLALRSLLEGAVDCPQQEFLEMFPILLARCEYRELLSLAAAAEQCVDAHGLDDCLSAIDRRKEELRRMSECYADVPRDVFICHSSVDSAKALRVLTALEVDGNQCWISSRNMVPDAPDYWERIERALQRCRVILVLCSDASMMSKDVQRELGMAERIGNARLEIKLDDTPHTTLFKVFFNGITWIDATSGMEGALSQAKRRVYDVLHPPVQHTSKPHAQPAGSADRTAGSGGRARKARKSTKGEPASADAVLRAEPPVESGEAVSPDEPRPEPDTAGQDALKPDVKPAMSDAPAPEAQSKAQDAPKPDVKPAMSDAPAPEAQSKAQDVLKSDAKSATGDASDPEAQSTAQDVPKLNVKPLTGDASNSEHQSAAQDASKPKAKTAAQHTNKSNAKTAPRGEPDTKNLPGADKASRAASTKRGADAQSASASGSGQAAVAERKRISGRAVLLLAAILLMHLSNAIELPKALLKLFDNAFVRSNADPEVLNCFRRWMAALPVLNIIVVAADSCVLMARGRSGRAFMCSLINWLAYLFVISINGSGHEPTIAAFALGYVFMFAGMLAPCLYMMRYIKRAGVEVSR